MTEAFKDQEQDLVFALDIGTRSIIGMAGRAVEGRLQVLAIEKQEHQRRAMVDGQIEDIAQVAKVVSSVTARLEQALGRRLRRVCIAAAGRALRTEKGRFQLALPGVRRVGSELIGQLEAGAVSDAEAALARTGGDQARFYLVGYTVTQYLLDRYPLSTLLDHNGQHLEAEVVATFLPAEVVESLYAAMDAAGLEVTSLTLEPIAALNAAIPADLRLLNLVLADIGAGTTDIAVCREGSVVGYTMATVAGDEITEALMRAYLVDFPTAEGMKAAMEGQSPVPFTDILGLSHQVTPEELVQTTAPAGRALAEELGRRVREVNGGPPSALFLAGGGSKLRGLRQLAAEFLEMDERRVAIAGNNFKISAFSDNYDLEDPEYATPLGIALSCALGLIHDSYRVTLNGQPARLFRSGALTALDVLMMNGYGYADLIGRTGRTLSVTVDGTRALFRGEPALPSFLRVNGKEAPTSTVIHTGDEIAFTPARPGRGAEKTLADVVGSDLAATCLLNGRPASANTPLHSGDEILTRAVSGPPPTQGPDLAPETEVATESETKPEGAVAPDVWPELPPKKQPLPEEPPTPQEPIRLLLNDRPLALGWKPEGPYYLMDLLERSGIDFKALDRPVLLAVNGVAAPFTQELRSGDQVTIGFADSD